MLFSFIYTESKTLGKLVSIHNAPENGVSLFCRLQEKNEAVCVIEKTRHHYDGLVMASNDYDALQKVEAYFN